MLTVCNLVSPEIKRGSTGYQVTRLPGYWPPLEDGLQWRLSAVLVSRKSLLILIRSQINDSLKCAQTLDNKPDAESFKRNVIYGRFGQGKKGAENTQAVILLFNLHIDRKHLIWEARKKHLKFNISIMGPHRNVCTLQMDMFVDLMRLMLVIAS